MAPYMYSLNLEELAGRAPAKTKGAVSLAEK